MPALVSSLLAFLFVVGNGFRKLGYLHFDVFFVIWIDGGVVGKGQDGENVVKCDSIGGVCCNIIFIAMFSGYYLPLICLGAFLQPPTLSFAVILRILPQLGCEFAAWFELDF
jgi:hypothetical protein